MACVEDDIREREADEFEKGLHIRFGGKREFTHGVVARPRYARSCVIGTVNR